MNDKIGRVTEFAKFNFNFVFEERNKKNGDIPIVTITWTEPEFDLLNLAIQMSSVFLVTLKQIRTWLNKHFIHPYLTEFLLRRLDARNPSFGSSTSSMFQEGSLGNWPESLNSESTRPVPTLLIQIKPVKMRPNDQQAYVGKPYFEHPVTYSQGSKFGRSQFGQLLSLVQRWQIFCGWASAAKSFIEISLSDPRNFTQHIVFSYRF